MPEIMSAAACGLFIVGCLKFMRNKNYRQITKRGAAGIIAGSLVFATALGGFNYAANKDAGGFTVSLKFENASKGLNQNGTRFDYTSLISKNMLEDVIKNGGYNITADELYNLLSVTSEYDNVKVDTDNPMIATQYTVHLSNCISKYKVDSSKLIEDIKKKCVSNYLTSTTDSHNALKVTFDGIDDVDYINKAEKLALEAGKMKRYLNSLKWDNATYRNEENETFSAMSQKVNDFVNVDLAKYKSFIKEKGVSNDKPGCIELLQYKNKMLSSDKDKQDAIYNSRVDGIETYDGNMAKVVLVPTEDENDEFYMSRTKIGVDYFATEAGEALDKASEINQEIEENNDMIKRLKASDGEVSEADFEKADEMILSMEDNLQQLSDQAIALFDDYVESNQNGYIKVEDEEYSVCKLADINSVIVYTAIFAAGLISIMSTGKKEEKR